jgi:ABC-type sugar transport system substrate-binding protein
MKRSLLALAVAAALAQAGHAEAANKTFGVLLKNVKDPYWAFVSEGAKAAAKEIGVDVVVLAADSDADVGPQLEICNTMIQRKFDAFVVAAVTPTGLFPCLSQLSKANIPILDIDANIVKDQADKAGIKVYNSIGSDNYQAGQLAADFVAKVMPKGKVLIIEGSPGSLPAIGRRDGFKEEAPKVDKDLDIVASLNANWDRSKAADIATDTITRFPDLGAIYCASDEMCVAAAEAARAAGKNDVITVGVDAMPDAIKAIKAGRMTGSVAQLPYLMGYQGVKMANDILGGKTFDPWKQPTPVFVVDKKILDANSEPLLKWVQQR